MRIPRWGVCLLGLGCCHFAGCSQTGWLRSNVPPDIKTVATVNGKPVSTISGEAGSGSSQREDARDIDPPPANDSRISGRVFDEEGRAVPNARVRLGVGGSAGGRVNFATTDRSGAFTLHGLRPGVNYTLIAEYQGEDGMMSGRAQAKAPGSGVRIGLGARDPEPEAEPKSASARLLPARVRSTLFPEDNTDGFPATAHPRAMAASEDQDAPAEEAAPSTSRTTTAKLASGNTATTTRAGWSARQHPSSGPDARSRAATDADETKSGPPTPDAVEDDGENPLPPALEPRDSTAARSARRDPHLYAAAPRPMPDDALPASGEIAPASYSQGGGAPADGDIVAPPRKTSNVRRGSRTTSTAASRSRDAGSSQDSLDPDSPAEDRPARSGPSRRPTWRELSISPDDVPVDEALHRSSGEDDGDDRGAVVLADGRSSRDDVEEDQGREVIEKAKPRRVRPTAGSSKATPANRSKAAASGPLEAICRMDPGHRRVLELRLPDLDGKMVSLRDIDADIIVLDFWGSWCVQCRKSIEHHRQLQEEFGDKKVQVIGIACEEAATFEGRRDTAAAAAKKFGINYPVLVTSKEGACPVQGALRVQFYPTMVVLDREGNILQFEQGATDATLGRIDRVIAKAVDSAVDSTR